MGKQPPTPDSLVPIILESVEVGPGGYFCCFDNALPVGVSMGHHPAPNARPRHPHRVCR